MRISIIALGSQGDVQPLVSLGLGLQVSGHQIQIVTHPLFERMARDVGLEFSPVHMNPREVIESEAGQKSLARRNPIRGFQDFAQMVSPFILQAGSDCLMVSQETDAILYSPLGSYVAPHIAERLDIPAIGAYQQPIHETSAFPSFGSPTQRNLGSVVNRLTYQINRVMFWLPYRSVVNQFRQECLNLPPIPRSVNYSKYWGQNMPVVYGFSPSVVPKPSDWGDHIEVTGYWFLDRPADWQPPADLVDFLVAGPPPVYIGFGSMSTRKPEERTDLVLQALARTKQRGVLATGWGGLGQAELPEDVFKIKSVPHDWLLPQMAAVVHHGGAGTTAAGLRAGIPSIVIPFWIDQPFWGRRVSDLRVGPEPISRKKLSVERLTTAIQIAVSDKEMRRRAVALGEHIRAEDGVARAVEAINRFICQR